MGYEGLEAGSEVFAHFQGSHCCCLHLARNHLKRKSKMHAVLPTHS